MSYRDVTIKSNSLYLKVEPGTPQVIRLLDESPTEQFKHSDGTKPVACTGDKCIFCMDGKAPMQRFVTNVFNQATQRVQLFEYGSMIAKQLKAISTSLAEENADIMNIDLKIESTGSGMQKKYAVTPRMNSASLPAGIKTIEIRSGADLPF